MTVNPYSDDEEIDQQFLDQLNRGLDNASARQRQQQHLSIAFMRAENNIIQIKQFFPPLGLSFRMARENA